MSRSIELPIRRFRPGPRAGAGSPGINLLELAVVLALITVAAAIAIPLFYSRPSVTLDNAAVLLARDLRAAQNYAVHRRSEVYVHFFGDGNGYRAMASRGEPLPNPTGTGELLRRYSADGVFEGVRIRSAEIGPKGMALALFTPDGLALYGGEIVLQYRGEERHVRLREGSGLVEIAGLERPWNDP